MAWSLYKTDIKTNRFVWLLLIIIFVFYTLMILGIYDPDSEQAMQDMMEMLPQSVIDAMGFSFAARNLTEYMVSFMYGMLIFMFPMVLSIIVNHRLIASYVDKGSMAYILATPNSRIKIAVTQAVFSLSSITLFFLIYSGATIGLSALMYSDALDMGMYLKLNLYTLLMYFAIGGIGFFASCLANDNKASLGIGVGLPVGFYVLQMLGNSNADIAWIKNVSLYALFDPHRLLAGEGFAVLGMLSFAVIALALYSAGIAVFHKKDLSI